MLYENSESPADRLTVCVTCAGAGTAKPSTEKKLRRGSGLKNAQTPQRQVHAVLGAILDSRQFCIFAFGEESRIGLTSVFHLLSNQIPWQILEIDVVFRSNLVHFL